MGGNSNSLDFYGVLMICLFYLEPGETATLPIAGWDVYYQLLGLLFVAGVMTISCNGKEWVVQRPKAFLTGIGVE